MAEYAMFGAGCFWGVEDAFRGQKGVLKTTVGFAGGHKVDPTYDEVCTKKTGHAEVVRVEFDPKKVTFDELMIIFWDIHDPTQVGRQGNDVGDQYRSVVFFSTPEQEQKVKAAKLNLQNSGRYKTRIMTQIQSVGDFYPAEEYHQQYYEKQKQASG